MKKGEKISHDPKKNRTFPKEVKEQLVHHTSELYLKGFSYRQIQKSIIEVHDRTVSLPTIGNYVAQLLREWREWRVSKLDDLKTVELNRINKLEQTYWDGWERSLEGTKRNSEKQTAKPGLAVDTNGKKVDTMRVEQAEKSSYTQETFGDPRFLGGIQWCITMRCKILGIEAPIEFKGVMTSEIKRVTVFKTRSRNRPD